MRHPPYKAASFFATICTVLLLSPTAAMATEAESSDAPSSMWVVEEGDRFIANTKDNIGYLVHKNGEYTSFLIASGQKRTVRYIGRIYNATTPLREWTVLSSEVKGDHVTFGRDGKFLRLYDKVQERTPYGIHTHASIRTMLQDEDRFRSMGCILVSEKALSVLERTFEVNGGSIQVSTIFGEPVLSTLVTEKSAMSS